MSVKKRVKRAKRLDNLMLLSFVIGFLLVLFGSQIDNNIMLIIGGIIASLNAIIKITIVIRDKKKYHVDISKYKHRRHHHYRR